MDLPMKILMVVTSQDRIDATHPTGVWFEEFATPYNAFRSKGLGVVVASPLGGRIPVDPRSTPSTGETGTAEAYHALEQSSVLEGLQAEEFGAIFLPGGHGTMYDLPDNQVLSNLISTFARQGKVIGAVCHGPAGLLQTQGADGRLLVAGKRLTAFTNAEERNAQLDQLMPFLLETRLRELGSHFVVQPPWSDHVERDGILITGQNPQSSRSVAQAILDALEEQ